MTNSSKLYFILIPVFTCLNLFASAFINIDSNKKSVVIETQIIYYGDSNILTYSTQATDEILRVWKNSKLVFPKNSKYENYKIILNLTTQVVNESKAFEFANKNTSAKNNYIRLENGQSNNESYILSNGANSGIWYMAQGIGKTKTAAHEFGHILGLPHFKPNELKNVSEISIMATRMTEVDLKYRNINSDTIYGFKDKLNISFRKVTASDLINLADIIYNAQLIKKSNQFEVGKAANFIFNKDGIPL